MNTKSVTRETYCRAETDRTFFNTLRRTGGVNRFFCFRQVTPLDKQTVVRMNKDTLYAAAIVDTAKRATITVPPMAGNTLPAQPISWSSITAGTFPRSKGIPVKSARHLSQFGL